MNTKSDKTIQNRWLSIDALRGVAVLFMILQHVTYWFCNTAKGKDVILVTGALGGLAAPIFVTLSGLGATFLAHRRENCDKTLVLRGAIIVAYGYLLNFLTPHWFDMASWYVLHMIGLALMTTPLLRRIRTPMLLVLFVVVLVSTILIQTGLNTPFRLFNEDMASPSKPGGLLRFIIAEGFFPVFPWLAFAIAGMISGRWLLADKGKKLWWFGLLLIGAMGALSALYYLIPELTRSTSFIRFFRLFPTFYPAMMPITLFLIGITIIFINLSITLDKKFPLRSSNFMVCLGRASLTILIVHVSSIREGAFYFRFWHKLDPIPGVIAVLLVITAFTVAAMLWRKINYKFGFEWLLRKIAD